MRWSEAGYLSQFVLPHALRQVSVSLILGVRQKKPKMTSRPYILFLMLCGALVANVTAMRASVLDGFVFIQTNPEIERHHAELAFLRSASNFEVALHVLAPDFNDAQRKKIENLKDAEASELKARKVILLEEMKTALAAGGMLYWGERKNADGFEKGFYILKDGTIVRRWLVDWGVRQKDGSLKTE